MLQYIMLNIMHNVLFVPKSLYAIQRRFILTIFQYCFSSIFIILVLNLISCSGFFFSNISERTNHCCQPPVVFGLRSYILQAYINCIPSLQLASYRLSRHCRSLRDATRPDLKQDIRYDVKMSCTYFSLGTQLGVPRIPLSVCQCRRFTTKRKSPHRL